MSFSCTVNSLFFVLFTVSCLRDLKKKILYVLFPRFGREGGQHRDHSAASGGIVWARGLLVSVCGLELRWDHQEPQSSCPHRLWVYSPSFHPSLQAIIHLSSLSSLYFSPNKTSRLPRKRISAMDLCIFTDSGDSSSEKEVLLTWDSSVPLNLSW